MIIHWETKVPRAKGIRIESVNRFNSRGASHVYGRGDIFGRGRSVNMEVWLTRGGRLLARFWSSSKGVPRFSYEVIGLLYDKMDLPRDVSFDRPVTEKHEHWVPHCLRVEYDTFTRDYLEGDYSD
jgi:hypothetical protein